MSNRLQHLTVCIDLIGWKWNNIVTMLNYFLIPITCGKSIKVDSMPYNQMCSHIHLGSLNYISSIYAFPYCSLHLSYSNISARIHAKPPSILADITPTQHVITILHGSTPSLPPLAALPGPISPHIWSGCMIPFTSDSKILLSLPVPVIWDRRLLLVGCWRWKLHVDIQ